MMGAGDLFLAVRRFEQIAIDAGIFFAAGRETIQGSRINCVEGGADESEDDDCEREK